MDCARIVGTKDTSKDMGRFQQTLHKIKSQRRPDAEQIVNGVMRRLEHHGS